MTRAALPTHLDLAIGRVPLLVVRNRRARRLALRICMAERALKLTLPQRLPLAQAQRFLDANAGWIAEQATLRLLPPVPFAPGVCLPVSGSEVQLQAGAGRLARRVGDVLLVPGAGDVFASRVRRWLKAEAQAVLEAESAEFAAKIGRVPAAVRVGDFRSRWGSCTADGRLAYSWRLLLAPVSVRRAVVAHEVAHLQEMNHSRNFWALATELLGAPHGPPRQWLRAHAPELMRYGAQVADSRAFATAAFSAS